MKIYQSKLNLLDTQKAIKLVKDSFERQLAEKLNLTRVTAPLFVYSNSGINDGLNGYERPVTFDAKNFKEKIEIVHSLAKWKRMALKKYGFNENEGLYTDMNAIRRDEDCDELHSLYVDQWDWEMIISKENRTFDKLKSIVKMIYEVVYSIGEEVEHYYPYLVNDLSKEITFISTSELEALYPLLSRKERENALCKKHGSVFLYQIGWPLKDGLPHDGRASDYDDWKLNGDILVWNEELQIAFELSSMGIRVDEESLPLQVQYKKELNKLDNDYAKGIINKQLPYTIGGGIGQSRLCMFFLKKHHIGEVQVSTWKEEDIIKLAKQNIYLL